MMVKMPSIKLIMDYMRSELMCFPSAYDYYGNINCTLLAESAADHFEELGYDTKYIDKRDNGNCKIVEIFYDIAVDIDYEIQLDRTEELEEIE